MALQLLSTNVDFASVNEAKQTISTSDEYSQHLTCFDRQAKIRTLRIVGELDYLRNCREYVRCWRQDEMEYVGAAIEQAHRRMRELEVAISLPSSILLVKTTGWEEGGANGYTRNNSIFLNEHSLTRDLVFHEIFHIISRFNEAKRDAIYESMGFALSNEISYDDQLRITNPDAPSLKHVLTLRHQGSEIEGVLVIKASREYGGGGFFEYVEKLVLVLDSADGVRVPRTSDGEEVLLRYDQVQGLYEQIGRNTAYNIHQEEVAAVHFTEALKGTVGLPDQHLLDELVVILRAT